MFKEGDLVRHLCERSAEPRLSRGVWPRLQGRTFRVISASARFSRIVPLAPNPEWDAWVSRTSADGAYNASNGSLEKV